jgi:hypothetical protein
MTIAISSLQHCHRELAVFHYMMQRMAVEEEPTIIESPTPVAPTSQEEAPPPAPPSSTSNNNLQTKYDQV